MIRKIKKKLHYFGDLVSFPRAEKPGTFGFVQGSETGNAYGIVYDKDGKPVPLRDGTGQGTTPPTSSHVISVGNANNVSYGYKSATTTKDPFGSIDDQFYDGHRIFSFTRNTKDICRILFNNSFDNNVQPYEEVLITVNGVQYVFSKVAGEDYYENFILDSPMAAYIVSLDGGGQLDIVLFSGVPATATSPGKVGDTASEPGFFYHCVAPNEWERVATATWV